MLKRAAGRLRRTGSQAMNRALIGFAAIVAGGACAGGLAWAAPIAIPRDVTAGEPVPVLSVRYYRHHRHHRHGWYRHYSHSQHSPSGGHSAREQTGAGAAKPGRWEFVAQLQTTAPSKSPGGTSLPPGVEPQSGGGIKTSYFGCVTPDKPIPVELAPQCKLDSTERNGSAITWSMTCTNPQDAVRSDGVARYSGDTMQATMISHLPGPNGKMTDMTQQITGHYVGRCTQQE
jgi:Protein of unknown function (DUF3617)